MKTLLFLFLYYVTFAKSLYFPWLAPVSYCRDEGSVFGSCKSKVKLFVNRLNTEESEIPYEYHHFDFCQGDESKSPVENLGQIVFGERIRPSPYNLQFLQNKSCEAVCSKIYNNNLDARNKLLQFRNGMYLNYQHHWIVDNMPITWCYTVQDRQYCRIGFPMGCYTRKNNLNCGLSGDNFDELHKYYLVNHVDLIITYHNGEGEIWGNEFRENSGRITSIKVEPRSILHSNNGINCKGKEQMEIPEDQKFVTGYINITYTYSIKYVQDNTIKWSSRWDHMYGLLPHNNIQWFSIFDSPVIVLILSGMIAVVVLRTLRRDIARYNQMECGEGTQEDVGWKLVHGDVFRPPRNRMLLSVLLGSGVQVFCMTIITLAFACLGFLSPANRGALMTCAMVLFVLLGTPAGYVSARIYKSFSGEKWKSNVLLTSMLCPGVVFGLFFVMNFILWGEGSSAAVPFTTFMALLALWFGVSVPLTFLGAYFGFKKRVLENPVRTNQIPRLIPVQKKIYTRPLLNIAMGGVLPFGCIYIQLFFILNSLWASQVYYMFGFLFLVFIFLVITCSESTIIFCYFHLCAEDYHWWWRSYLTSGFTAVYLFIYCCHYFVTKLSIEDAASTFLYFGYTLIMVFLFNLLTGTIGFFACFWFIRKIYSVVKVD